MLLQLLMLLFAVMLYVVVVVDRFDRRGANVSQRLDFAPFSLEVFALQVSGMIAFWLANDSEPMDNGDLPPPPPHLMLLASLSASYLSLTAVLNPGDSIRFNDADAHCFCLETL